MCQFTDSRHAVFRNNDVVPPVHEMRSNPNWPGPGQCVGVHCRLPISSVCGRVKSVELEQVTKTGHLWNDSKNDGVLYREYVWCEIDQ